MAGESAIGFIGVHMVVVLSGTQRCGRNCWGALNISRVRYSICYFRKSSRLLSVWGRENGCCKFFLIASDFTLCSNECNKMGFNLTIRISLHLGSYRGLIYSINSDTRCQSIIDNYVVINIFLVKTKSPVTAVSRAYLHHHSMMWDVITS